MKGTVHATSFVLQSQKSDARASDQKAGVPSFIPNPLSIMQMIMLRHTQKRDEGKCFTRACDGIAQAEDEASFHWHHGSLTPLF